MIIPHDFPDDLINYIYSLIIYNQKKELLNEIILFKNTKNKFLNKYIKNYNNYDEYVLLLSINIRKLILNNNDLSFKIPNIILKNYTDLKYTVLNKAFLLNLFLFKNLKKLSKILDS